MNEGEWVEKSYLKARLPFRKVRLVLLSTCVRLALQRRLKQNTFLLQFYQNQVQRTAVKVVLVAP